MSLRLFWGLLMASGLAWAAEAEVRVPEDGASVRFRSGVVVVGLRVDGVKRTFPAVVSVEWVDPMDVVLAAGQLRRQFAEGSNAVEVELPSPVVRVPEEKREEMIWHRLRCRVRDGRNGQRISESVLPVSSIESNLFVLHLLPDGRGEEEVHDGRLVVRTVHPVTEQGVAGVNVKLGPQEAVTDEAGVARLQTPESGRTRQPVEGWVGDYRVSAAVPEDEDRQDSIQLASDKGVYQPGQTIKVRALAFAATGRPMAAEPVRFRIRQDGRTLFEQTVKSTRFGVAAAEWTLPHNATRGRYWITAEAGKSAHGSHLVSVSRYEAPRFMIKATTDKPWYQPGENAVVRVTANYIFGRPLPKGRVEVGGAAVAPVTLVDGVANVVLRTEAPPYGSRTRVAVSVTSEDGETESYWLEMTVSASSIGVEMLGHQRLREDGAAEVYVRTTYPDGTPAQCDVELELRRGDVAVGTWPLRTNRHGAAVAKRVRPGGRGSYTLTAVARDTNGWTGKDQEAVEVVARPVRIAVERRLYKPGEAVKVRIESNNAEGLAQVAALHVGSVLDFQTVRLVGGMGEYVFTPPAGLGGAVTFVANVRQTIKTFILNGEIGAETDSVPVWIRSRPRLQVEFVPERSEYRPGERVRGVVRVSSAGRPVEAAVGLSVVDRAILAPRERREPVDARKLDDVDVDEDGQVLAGALWASDGEFVTFPSLFQPQLDAVYHARVEKDSAGVRGVLSSARRAGRDYPATANELTGLLRRGGLDVAGLTDPWGGTYRVALKTELEKRWVEMASAGPDRVLGTSDDATAVVLQWRWFDGSAGRIAAALAKEREFPRTAEEFGECLRRNNLAQLLEPGGGPQMEVDVTQEEVGLTDANVYGYGSAGTRRTDETAPKVKIMRLPVIGLSITKGKERRRVAAFAAAPAPAALAQLLRRPRAQAIAKGASGGVRGKATMWFFDEELADVSIEAMPEGSSRVWSARTGPDGAFAMLLPPGRWTVRASRRGFTSCAVVDVPVVGGVLTELNFGLRIRSLKAAVEEIGELSELQTSSASSVPLYAKKALPPAPVAEVRRDFPESMVWMPLLETGADGRAEVEFKLADSITTWSALTVGSTMMGAVNESRREIIAFQPLFTDVRLPSTLTEGDEVAVRATVSNYTQAAVEAGVQVEASGGVAVVNDGTRRVAANAGGQGTATIQIRANGAGKRGRVLVSAASGEWGDRVERPVEVKPYARQVDFAQTAVTPAKGSLRLEIPAEAATSPVVGRIRVYRSLMAHLHESRTAILTRPWGCGEQTISSAFPNLLWLELWSASGGPKDADYEQALKNLRAGYDRLVGYQAEGGGFGYFDKADPALTAYALEFLPAAAKFVDVDPTVVARAERWLSDRPWESYGANVAALIAARGTGLTGAKRVAAMKAVEWLESQGGGMSVYTQAALLRAYVGLRERTKVEEWGRRLTAAQAGDGHWASVEVTPFYGLGRAADVEVTAMVVVALEQARNAGVMGLDDAIRKGVAWLLRAKDEHGVWHSTQATVRALQALAGALEFGGGTAGSLSVVVNGGVPRNLDAAQADRYLELDVSGLLRAGKNSIEVSDSKGTLVVASLTGHWYQPWSSPAPSQGGVDFAVIYDRTEVVAGGRVRCRLSVQRVTPSGRGMLVVEAGLPPGAEVDRTSLEELVRRPNSRVYRYEVETDRVILYVWPGDERFEAEFGFRLVYPMRAKTVASKVWEYYRPEAGVVTAPVEFVVQDE